MKKMSRKLLTLCLVCIMTVGISVFAYADQVSPVIKDDSQSGSIPPGGSAEWVQPNGFNAFCVSVWNRGDASLTATIIYPNGNRDRHTVQPGLNEMITVDNDAPEGTYEIDFSSSTGIVSGEYRVSWSTNTDTSKSGTIPSSGGATWEQPDGSRAFRVSVWNQGGEALKVTLTYPDGRKEECTLQSGANKVISVDNDAAAGRYEIDFITPSGVIAGEYGVRWSTEPFNSDPAFVSEMSPVTGASKYGRNPIGSTRWVQPDGHKAFCVRVWNQGDEALKVAISYPDGRKEERTLQAGVNKVIYIDNNAPAGRYELNFSTSSGVVTGEYEVTWSTVSFT